ncbi:MAG: cyclic nucleotide-binding domain-containing protein [Gammaproteobacteria bacterium]|nr:cyclic nucleotide-binding domain-containing protein [Gammaproteobacteria bacterium]
MTTFHIFNNEPDTMNYDAGQPIFAEGDPGNGSMYAVLEGEVEIVHHSELLTTIPAGSIFGEMALIDHYPRSASAKAKTACRVAVINEKRFNLLVAQHPTFALEMMRVLTERLRNNLSS